MRKDDQYFKPGDKVMRVSSGHGPLYKGPDTPKSSPEFGKVYCVEDFFEGPQYNAVMLVGFGGWAYANGMPVGWLASAFRRVDEIQLCVNAANAAKAAGKEAV